MLLRILGRLVHLPLAACPCLLLERGKADIGIRAGYLGAHSGIHWGSPQPARRSVTSGSKTSAASKRHLRAVLSTAPSMRSPSAPKPRERPASPQARRVVLLKAKRVALFRNFIAVSV